MRSLVCLALLLAAGPALAQTQPTQNIWLSATAPWTCNLAQEGSVYENTTSHQLFYCNGSAWTGVAGSASISGTTNTLAKFTSSTAIGNSTVTDDGTLVTINGSTVVRAAISGASVGSNFLSVSGTFPSTLTDEAQGARFDFTPATSSNIRIVALTATLEAGYSGGQRTSAFSPVNSTGGTGNQPFGSGDIANYGIFTYMNGDSANSSFVALAGIAANGNSAGTTGIGLFGRGMGGVTRVGVIGTALSGSGTNTGGYFTLRIGTSPTFETAALIADNDSQAAPIFIARDNGARVFSIEDGGQVNLTSDASRAIHSGNKALTEGVATAISQVGIPSGSSTGFIIDWTVYANDGTDFQSRIGSSYVAGVNKAGTETCTVSDIGTSALAESAGASTLTVTTACSTSPTNAVNFTIDATSSLTQTTLATTWIARKMVGTGSITPQ